MSRGHAGGGGHGGPTRWPRVHDGAGTGTPEREPAQGNQVEGGSQVPGLERLELGALKVRARAEGDAPGETPAWAAGTSSD